MEEEEKLRKLWELKINLNTEKSKILHLNRKNRQQSGIGRR